MYIGQLDYKNNVTFTHAGTALPFDPEKNGSEIYWKWTRIYDTAVDINILLEKKSYVGAIEFTLKEGSAITKAEALIDGRIAGNYRAESGKQAKGEILIPIGVSGDAVTLRLYADMADVRLDLPIIFGAYQDGNPLIYPTPASVEWCDGTVIPGNILDYSCPNLSAAADYLRLRLSERSILFDSEKGAPITLEIDGDRDFGAERFILTVSDKEINIRGGSRIALMYAITALLQLEKDGAFRKCRIDDHPEQELRGFHMGLPRIEKLEFAKSLLRYVLIPMRYNMLFIEFNAQMRFDRHPEINEGWIDACEKHKKGLQPKIAHEEMGAEGTVLEKADVRRLIDWADELGLEVIPEIQSLSHVQYITNVHPEIAEREETAYVTADTRSEDARPDDFYPHSYCPSLQASYDIIYDIIDEVVEVVRPRRYVHMGHDEVYQIGLCPRCKGKDHAELYAKHVNAMYSYLKKKGLGMVIWSDMLQPTERYKTFPAVNMIPKDILLLDFIWYFHFDMDLEDNLLPYGFKVGMGNLYSSHYPRFSSRIAKQGICGGQVSTWTAATEKWFANLGKFFDVTYTAEMLWRTSQYDQRLRRVYAHIISNLIQPRMRDEVRGVKPKACNTSVKIPLPNGCNNALPEEIRSLLPNALIPESGAKTKIKAKAKRLILGHATVHNRPIVEWEPFSEIGHYTVEYSDRSEEIIPICYGTGILRYDLPYAEPFHGQYYRHHGYMATWYSDPLHTLKSVNGEDVTVYGFVWENPYPEKEISSLSYTAENDDQTVLFITDIIAQN
ncbi:MAG: family 20 glycosylhydrolase [Clostridia bacterium]|nr:family 20 glycosylhydrolase [Clostridia bacterium]